jgi:hypothetical protein
MDTVLCAHPRLHGVGILKQARPDLSQAYLKRGSHLSDSRASPRLPRWLHHRYFVLLALVALGAAGVLLLQQRRIEAALSKEPAEG